MSLKHYQNRCFSIITVLFLLLFTSCANKKLKIETDSISHKKENQKNTISFLVDNLKNAKNHEVIVVSHRGDWRNAPENSLQAIKNCITMGVDMVEIDIRETKDGQLILMHDETINRTTNGSGKVSNWTLDSLKTLQLKDGLGQLTPHKIPTLKEALLVAKDRILVNLDKSYPIFDKCYEVIKITETARQVVIKGDKTREQVEKEFGAYLDKVHFMPVIQLPNPNVQSIIDNYMLSNPNPPVAFEFIFADADATIKAIDFSKIRAAGFGVWVNSLWPRLNGGHDDESAVFNENIYQWYLDNNIDIIQTDRPQLLISFLKKRGAHL